eukprot:9520152-Lingulodinium_polyedra.AAC.1
MAYVQEKGSNAMQSFVRRHQRKLAEMLAEAADWLQRPLRPGLSRGQIGKCSSAWPAAPVLVALMVAAGGPQRRLSLRAPRVCAGSSWRHPSGR